MREIKIDRSFITGLPTDSGINGALLIAESA